MEKKHLKGRKLNIWYETTLYTFVKTVDNR